MRTDKVNHDLGYLFELVRRVAEEGGRLEVKNHKGAMTHVCDMDDGPFCLGIYLPNLPPMVSEDFVEKLKEIVGAVVKNFFFPKAGEEGHIRAIEEDLLKEILS